jgi:hypothetical protein
MIVYFATGILKGSFLSHYRAYVYIIYIVYTHIYIYFEGSCDNFLSNCHHTPTNNSENLVSDKKRLWILLLLPTFLKEAMKRSFVGELYITFDIALIARIEIVTNIFWWFLSYMATILPLLLPK